MNLLVLASFLAFGVWLTLNLHKSRNTESDLLKAFWQKEREANSVRKKSLEHLDYISIPLKTLPINVLSNNEEVKEYTQMILTLSNEKIVNLTGITNTDLKLMYGAANITALTEYDHNFTLLCRTLYQWAEVLYKEGFVADSKTVLEFGIETGSDVSGNYKLLAQIYNDEGQSDKIKALYKRAEELNGLMKKPILKALSEICHDLESPYQ